MSLTDDIAEIIDPTLIDYLKFTSSMARLPFVDTGAAEPEAILRGASSGLSDAIQTVNTALESVNQALEKMQRRSKDATQ